MSENKKLIEKIKKLQEKAESAKSMGSLEEANAFFEKVQQLLLENNFSLDDILNHKTKEEIEYLQGKENGITFFENVYEGPYWEPALMHSICKNNNCFCYHTNYSNKVLSAKYGYLPYITVVGKPSDKEICLYFYYMTRDILRKLAIDSYNNRVAELREKYKVKAYDWTSAKYGLMEIFMEKAMTLDFESRNLYYSLKNSYEDVKDLFMPSSYAEKDMQEEQIWYIKNLTKLGLISNRTTYIQSFLLGASQGIDSVLNKQKQTFINNLDDNKKEQISALIKVQVDELEKFVEDKFSNMKTTSNYLGDKFAYRDGVEKSKGLNLNKGINQQTGNFIKTLK